MPTAEPTAKAQRTRRDIVTAAIERWSVDNSASLGDIAAAAGVGRTTVNRYFSDRAQLIAAVDDECRSRYATAVARARPDQGTGLEALLRICTELMQLGGVLALTFADNAVIDPDTWYDEDDDPLGLVLARGLTDGSIATDLPGEWIGTVVWTSLFAAWLMIKNSALTWHEAAGLLTRTLSSGIGGR